MDMSGVPVRVVATHLGIERRERKKQIQHILDEMEMCSDEISILMGDLNEWNPLSRSLKLLRSFFDRLPAPISYPSRFPMLALDRVLVRPGELVTGISVVNTPLTKLASDHLPVRATVKSPVYSLREPPLSMNDAFWKQGV
jgi:endonuclease/exonuclease/phosphatase family metal-dependent hydrolase